MLWTCAKREHGSVEHQAREGDEVQASHGFGQPRIVLHQPMEECRPREAALDHPPPRKQHESFLGPQVLDQGRMMRASATSAGFSPV